MGTTYQTSKQLINLWSGWYICYYRPNSYMKGNTHAKLCKLIEPSHWKTYISMPSVAFVLSCESCGQNRATSHHRSPEAYLGHCLAFKYAHSKLFSFLLLISTTACILVLGGYLQWCELMFVHSDVCSDVSSCRQWWCHFHIRTCRLRKVTTSP